MRPGRRIGTLLAVSLAGSGGAAATYSLGGHPQLEGTFLAASLGGLGGALVLWARHLLPSAEISEDLEPSASSDLDVDEAARDLGIGQSAVTRRKALSRLLGLALAGIAAAVLFPARSLVPRPGRSLVTTAWSPGARLVREDGSPVHVDDLPVGGILTVFPEGHLDASDSQTVIVRVDPGELRLPVERHDWAPEGFVAYSKLCTHAGCPVGLYSQEARELFCPCHQSSFDVLRSAVPTLGPATRPLPQLPLRIDEEGHLRARSDFPEPVGAAFWRRA